MSVLTFSRLSKMLNEVFHVEHGFCCVFFFQKKNIFLRYEAFVKRIDKKNRKRSEIV